MQVNKNQTFITILLILLGFSGRLLPHPANFAPIGAIALFGALYLPKRYAILAPLLAMFCSDLIIGFYTWETMFSVYVSFVLMGVIGLWVRERKSFQTVLGGTLLGSVVFFLMTNLAVWAFDKMYPLNVAGLVQSYIMAIPFFKYSILGDVFYVGVLVGGMEMIRYFVSKSVVVTQAK